MAPINATRDDFVVSLKEYATVTKVVEEGVNGWLDIERIQPERENTGFAFTLRVEIFHFELLLFGDGIEAWVSIK